MTVTLDLDTTSSDTHARRLLSNLSLSVAKCKKIVVVSGAGISCSCGIPDFRSSDGLYALVKQQYPDVVMKGRDLFDASLFRDPTSTAVFYTFISELKKSIDGATPSPTHEFIKTLDSKRKLLRSYTQNIDGLEERAGLMGTSSEEVRTNGAGSSKIKTKEVRNVQLHGDIHRVRCTYCSADFPFTQDHLDAFLAGNPPDCPECAARSFARVARSARAIKVGTLRPAIVLYDEPHPLGDDIGTIQTADIARKPDMLIIMGTSLKVHGFKKLVKDFARAVHESAPPASLPPGPPLKKTAKSFAGKVVFVNKTAPGSEWDGIIDYHVAGETDRWVEKVLEDWKKSRPQDWEVQQTLVAAAEPGTSSGDFQFFHHVKDVTNTGAVKEITNTVCAKAKGAKRKNHRKRENRPAAEKDDVDVWASNDMSISEIFDVPPLPPSPSKRPQSRCHYDGVESSPSKRSREGAPREPVHFEERGMLFGKASKAGPRPKMARGAPEDDSIDMGTNAIVSPSRRPKAAKKPRVRKAQSQALVDVPPHPAGRPSRKVA